MNYKSTFEFTVDKETRTVTVQREFDAGISRVWDAWTKPEYLDKWWAPKPWRAKTISMEFKEGGHWHYAMLGPSGEEHHGWVDYEKIVEQKNFTGYDAFADNEGNVNRDLPRSKWDVKFIDKGDVTLVHFDNVYDSLEQIQTVIEMGMKEGIATAMEGLDEILEKG